MFTATDINAEYIAFRGYPVARMILFNPMNTYDIGVPITITRMNSRAYGSVSFVAPNNVNISSRKIYVNVPNTAAWMRQSAITVFTTSVARMRLRCPRNIELIVAPPTAISVQKPITKFINGNVMARPEIANGPTP